MDLHTGIRSNQSQITTEYICGSKWFKLILECGKTSEFKPDDNLICKDCNGRIFYKKRTRQPVQFEARWFQNIEFINDIKKDSVFNLIVFCLIWCDFFIIPKLVIKCICYSFIMLI